LLNDTVAAYTRALQIAQNQYHAGTQSSIDYVTDLAQLQSTQAQLVAVGVQRQQYEHAIAMLTGHAPAELTIAPAPLAAEVPIVPPGLPSALLERRPDIARAERTMEAMNAQIGVAVAGYFPQISLTGQFGYMSYSVKNLFTMPSEAWSFGPSIQLPLFTGGKTTAEVKSARADYDAAVADYRSTVLGAFRDVEDSLAAQRYLAEQAEAVDRAAIASSQARQLSEERYKSGQINYFEVTDSQRTELAAQRSQAQIVGQRLYASIRLIKALGGGWDQVALRAEEPGVGLIPGSEAGLPVTADPNASH